MLMHPNINLYVVFILLFGVFVSIEERTLSDDSSQPKPILQSNGRRKKQQKNYARREKCSKKM